MRMGYIRSLNQKKLEDDIEISHTTINQKLGDDQMKLFTDDKKKLIEAEELRIATIKLESFARSIIKWNDDCISMQDMILGKRIDDSELIRLIGDFPMDYETDNGDHPEKDGEYWDCFWGEIKAEIKHLKDTFYPNDEFPTRNTILRKTIELHLDNDPKLHDFYDGLANDLEDYRG